MYINIIKKLKYIYRYIWLINLKRKAIKENNNVSLYRDFSYVLKDTHEDNSLLISLYDLKTANSFDILDAIFHWIKGTLPEVYKAKKGHLTCFETFDLGKITLIDLIEIRNKFAFTSNYIEALIEFFYSNNK